MNTDESDEMKKFFFFLPFLIEFFLDDEKFICFFSPLCFPQKNTNLSLSVCVVLLYYTLYKKRARGGVKLFFSRFYNRIELLSLFFSDRGEKDRERKERTLLLLNKRFLRFCLRENETK